MEESNAMYEWIRLMTGTGWTKRMEGMRWRQGSDPQDIAVDEIDWMDEGQWMDEKDGRDLPLLSAFG